MIDRDAAHAIARTYLGRTKLQDGTDLVVREDRTLEKPFGWVVFWDSRTFVETGDPRLAAIGNGPLIIDRVDGSVHPTGSTRPIERFFDRYDRERATRAGR
ncbi:MAG: hypothetical protein JJD97_11525 [Gemmatimonadaceae bacterium]|nr:hypothetical protein [Gemmatimonadaceae bacterium]